MTIFWLAYFIILSLYCLIILLFAFGWKFLQQYRYEESNCKEKVFFSVIIPYRNEYNNLDQLFEQLFRLDYPVSDYEVILVDDHSSDGSDKKVKELIIGHQNYHSICCNSATNGKKAALRLGANDAKGEVLVFTDADCLPPASWLKILKSFYLSNSRPDLIIGLVDLLPRKSILSNCFRIEFLSLMLSSSGAAALQNPVMCNGANLAVKRSEYLRATDNLHDDIASGDDVFLLHHFKKENKRIGILKSKEHLVYTSTPESLSEFIVQRVRWGSKSTKYNDIASIFLSLLVLISNLVLLLALAIGIFYSNYTYALAGYCIKAGADVVLFISGNKFFSLKSKLLLVPFIEMLYPFYILIVSVLTIKRPFAWKGRKN